MKSCKPFINVFRCPNDVIQTFATHITALLADILTFLHTPKSNSAHLLTHITYGFNAKGLSPNNGSWRDWKEESCDSKTIFLPLSSTEKFFSHYLIASLNDEAFVSMVS